MTIGPVQKSLQSSGDPDIRFDLANYFSNANNQQSYSQYAEGCKGENSSILNPFREAKCFTSAPADLQFQKIKKDDSFEFLNKAEFDDFAKALVVDFKKKYKITLNLNFNDAAIDPINKGRSPQGEYDSQLVSRTELVHYLQRLTDSAAFNSVNVRSSFHSAPYFRFYDSIAKAK